VNSFPSARSHKLLVRTIFAIFVLRTIAVVGHIYTLWTAFIKYGVSPMDSYLVLMGTNDKAVVWINPLVSLTCVLNIAIVDFIMVSGRFFATFDHLTESYV
jgi:hypothetical protein